MARVGKVVPDFSRDRWETWLRCGLMTRAQRIPGTNDYGLDPEQWDRLQRLVLIDRGLFGRKSPGAVAYFAAVSGIDVPVDLIADHMEKSIRTFYKHLRWRLIQQSNGRLDPRMLDESDARKLARKLADDILGFTPIGNPIKRVVLRQFAEALSLVVVQLAFVVQPSRTLGGAVRQIASRLFEAPAVTLGARLLKKAIDSEGARFVDPDKGDNQLLREIRSTQRDQPQLIAQACHDSGLAFDACIRGFGVARHGKGPPNHLTGTARENARGFYSFLPMVSAYFLTFALDYEQSRFLELVRRSNGAELEQQVRRMDHISEWYRGRLRRGL